MSTQALALREKVLGKEHPDTLVSMNNLVGHERPGEVRGGREDASRDAGTEGEGVGKRALVDADEYEQSGTSTVLPGEVRGGYLTTITMLLVMEVDP